MQAIKNLLKGLFKDIGVVLLDAIAVNAAYYLALMIRYFVNFSINPSAQQYVESFFKFAPWYTIACIIVFALFRLYNNMWKYAGMNDLNRIISASFVTCVIHILGTLLFIRRMPLSYYAIGAMLQAFFVFVIRFLYRFIVVERSRLKKRNLPMANATVIGVGEIGRKVVQYLEESFVYRVVCLVDFSNNSGGRMLNGVPVISGKELFTEAISRYGIKTVFLASPVILPEVRDEIHKFCQDNGLELQDYTGFLSNLTGNVSVMGLMEVTKGSVSIVIDGEVKRYKDGEEAILDLRHQYQVQAISATDEGLIIELQEVSAATNKDDERWMQAYKEETGEDVSFF